MCLGKHIQCVCVGVCVCVCACTCVLTPPSACMHTPPNAAVSDLQTALSNVYLGLHLSVFLEACQIKIPEVDMFRHVTRQKKNLDI